MRALILRPRLRSWWVSGEHFERESRRPSGHIQRGLQLMTEAGGERGVCLVVGAGDGLGAPIAHAFAREGLRVCVTRRPRNTEAVDKLAEAVRAEGGEAHAFGLDARVEDDVAALIERIEREIGPIEVLVFNIGANVRFRSVKRPTRG